MRIEWSEFGQRLGQGSGIGELMTNLGRSFGGWRGRQGCWVEVSPRTFPRWRQSGKDVGANWRNRVSCAKSWEAMSRPPGTSPFENPRGDASARIWVEGGAGKYCGDRWRDRPPSFSSSMPWREKCRRGIVRKFSSRWCRNTSATAISRCKGISSKFFGLKLKNRTASL